MNANVKVDGFDVHPRLTLPIVMAAVERAASSLDDPGFCLACGNAAFGVEPDAHGYECEACGEEAVIGAQDLLMELA